MKERTKSRSKALQVLYQSESHGGLLPERALSLFQGSFTKGETIDPFTQKLVEGVVEHLSKLDEAIESISEHWKMSRMTVIDRNILRLGFFELNYCDDIPSTVTINELVEVAKEFGSENSAAFINGILDKAKSKLTNPNKAP